jgi:tetratricopeptide (TPR) repeat protein
MTKNFDLRLNEALDQHRAGRPDLAEPVYRELFEENPGNAELNHLLGIIELAKDHHQEAEVFIAQAIRRDDTVSKYHNTLGALLRETGRNQEAVEAYQMALRIEPGFTQARHNLGEAFRTLGMDREAEGCFVTILETEPDNVDALNNFATFRMADYHYDEALEPLRHAATLAPDNARVLTNLLKCLEHMSLLAEASEVVFKLEAAGPGNARGKLIAARVERRTGRAAQAAGSLRGLLKKQLKPSIHSQILFELGLVLDRTGKPDEAFEIFTQANAVQPLQDVDPARYRSRVARDRNWFTAENLGLWEDSVGEVTPAPVFLVGFPRSGTTLLEQILRAHPGIVSTGEASPLEKLRNHLHQQGNFPECLGTAEPEDIKKWQDLFAAYCHDINGEPLDGRVIIDKTPLNIAEMGLINRLFPNAKIVTALRDPRDVCLSCLMQNYQPDDALTNFNDLQSSVQLYVLIMEYWQHCRQNMALPWIEIRYEDLTRDFEFCTRRVLDFIDIPWSDDVKQYRDGILARPITTAGFRDMANPMYTHAVGRWLKYRQHLELAYEPLAPFIEDFGYTE